MAEIYMEKNNIFQFKSNQFDLYSKIHNKSYIIDTFHVE